MTDAMTVRPDSTTARPEVAIAASRGLLRIAARPQFLAEPHKNK